MIIGVLQASFIIPDSFNVKDKRSAVKSIKERLRSRFNVSVAEVGGLESINTAQIGVVAAANDTRFMHESLSHVVSFLEGDKRIVLTDIKTEVIP